MKYLKLILCILLSLNIAGCNQATTTIESDFWIDTIDTIENTAYDEDKWNINVMSVEYAEMAGDDTTYRNVKISQDVESETLSTTTSFSLYNDDGDKTLIYTYQTRDILNSDEYIDQKVVINSYGNSYYKYEIYYYYEEYINNSYANDKEATGLINISTTNEIAYDNVPLLNVAINAFYNLICDFEVDFNIDYSSYNDFVNLPELAQDLNIPDIDDVSEEASTTIDYYGEEYYNAKGYTMIRYLRVSKDYATVEFGTYSKEQNYSDGSTMTLETRGIDNCYNMVPKNDPDVYYSVYLNDTIVYVYLQSDSDEYIQNDVLNNSGSEAHFILKTTNEGF